MSVLKTAATWAVALSTIVASGLTLLGNSKITKTNHNHFEMCCQEGAAPESQVFVSDEAQPNSLPSGVAGSIVFPGGGSGEETFLTEGIVASLPSELLYHGENMASYCEQPLFVKDYFRNMTVEFPTNDDDRNCGYVAFSMLLSYYDTYWNSGFIDDKYNTSTKAHLDSLTDTSFVSPGVKEHNIQVWSASHPEPTEPGPGATEEEKTRYNNTLRSFFNNYLEKMLNAEYVNQYLMSYLYSIGMEAGVLAYHTHPIPTISLEGLKAISDIYVKRIESFYHTDPFEECFVEFCHSLFYSDKYLNYQTEDEKREAVRNDIVEKVRQGQPLILIGDLRKEDGSVGGRHLVIAYEYDEQNDIIYGHMGGKAAGRSRVNLDNAFYNIDGYGYFDISSYVRYSQSNPRFEVNGVDHDACDLSSHVHRYNERFHYGNPTMHAVQCSCGHIRYATHAFTTRSNGTKFCVKCSYFANKGGWQPSLPGIHGF